MKYLRTIDKRTLRGTRVLVRADLNTEGADALRIEAILPTLKHLTNAGAVSIMISHRGRPARRNSKASLKRVARILSLKMGRPVIFLATFDFPRLRQRIANAKNGTIFLLENVRFELGEEKNDVRFARKLATLGKLYVNDAFAVSHRAHASIAQLPHLLPAYAGFGLEAEIKNLSTILRSKRHPLVIILGGAKAKDKLGVIQHFIKHADVFLIGGRIANTFMKARGDTLLSSNYDTEMISEAKRLLNHAKIVLPVDFIAHKGNIFDLGPETIRQFATYIRSAKMIVWNGPLGKFEDDRFAGSSRELVRILAKSKAFTLAGGGETTALIRHMKLEKKFNFLSTGGGAMLDFLAGKKLPGIEALDRHHKS